MLFVLSSFAFTFDGVSITYEGVDFQSATFHKENLIYGLDFIHANISSEQEVCTNSNYYGGCYDYDNEEISTSINIFMPRVGIKMKPVISNKILIYNEAEGYLVLPLVSIDAGGSSNSTANQEEAIEDILDVMGIKISKVIQYNFTDQFSLLAHIGFNLTFGDIDDDTVGSSISGRFGITYTQFALKFTL